MLSFSEILLICAVSLAISLLVCLIYARLTARSGSAQHHLTGNAQHRLTGCSTLLFDGACVVDSSHQADLLLQNCADADTDWTKLRQTLLPRFPDFPMQQPTADTQTRRVLPSADLGAGSRVEIEPLDGATRVSLIDDLDSVVYSPAERHLQRYRAHRMEVMQLAVQQAPYPIWKTNIEGRIVWTNQAYNLLASAVLEHSQDEMPDLFDQPSPPPQRRRVSLKLQSSGDTLWYDVTSVAKGACHMHYATDINAVIQAEAERRNFVQTLTKTFAQLSIGLAIFDRKQELTLFNPALTALTELPIGFLSNRPSLHAFFDRLRDTQIMPEPRDYHSWRLNLTALVEKARDGCYQDIWCLPSGLTYRVSGRPHPDGAIAFLFEDISAEMSMSRRFRADLELNQAVLNVLEHPIAVFSASGMMNFSNQAYGRLWGGERDTALCEVALNDAIRLWAEGSDQPWRSLLTLVAKRGPEGLSGLQFTLPSNRAFQAEVARITGGAVMVQFKPLQQQQTRQPQVQTA